MDIGTHRVGDIIALPPGDGVIDGPGNLLKDLLGNLAAHWLRGSCPDHGRGVSLQGKLSQGDEEAGGNVGLHGEKIIKDLVLDYGHCVLDYGHCVLDCGHCVRLVIGGIILTLVSRALPLIDIMALDQGGGAGLGQKPGLDDVVQPL